MKGKLLKKVMAIVLSMVMLSSFIPFGNLLYAYAETQPQSIEITNPDFESDVQILGWTRQDGATEDNMSVTSTAGDVFAGNGALKLYDPGAGYAPWLYSDNAAVTTGQSITLSAEVKVESGTAQLSIWYTKNDGTVVAEKDYGTGAGIGTCDWTELTVNDTVPDGADNASVFIWSGGGDAATAYYDDVSLTLDSGENMVTNPGFEDAVVIPGWNRIYGDGSDFSISDSIYYGDSGKSLKVSDQVTDAGKWMYSNMYDVTPGDQLTASAMVKVDAGYLELCIKYQDDNGNDVGAYPDTTVSAGDWSQQSVSGTVPDGATKAVVFIYSGMGAVTTAYVDDVTLSKIPAQVQPPVNAGIITNPGFEDAINEDGTIPGWNRIYGDENDFSVSDSAYYSGSKSLKVSDQDSGAGKWMYSDRYDVTPGNQLTASAMVKVDAGYLELCIKYQDDNGNDVGAYPDTTVSAGNWSQQSVSGTVPDGATKAVVFIYSGMSAVTTAYVDDVTLSEEPAMPANLTPKVLIDYDGSSLTDLIDNGWMVSSPQVGAYTTDSAHSTGTPADYTLKDVPDGQTLFYMDSDAGEGNIDAFKLVDSTNRIDNSPWKLELDMKLQDLMTATSGNVESGFSIMVNTGNTVNRINFAGDNKIRVETVWADPTPEFKEAPADLHIGDGEFHHWNIDSDGNGTINFYCDGIKTAEFDGITFANDYEPGLQFINYYNGIASGSNEIYFDNIKLTEYVDNPGTDVTAGAPVNLGQAVKSGPLVCYSITGRNHITNSDELYTVSTGSQDDSSVFYALDPYTGEVHFKQKITGMEHAYAIAQGSDGNIYFAGTGEGGDNGDLYKYTPGVEGQGKIDCIGANSTGYTWVWDMAASSDGKLYGATYTDSGAAGRIFEYDISTGGFTDLGVAKDGATYIRGLGVTDNYIYAGVGMPDALIRISRSDMSKTQIDIPAFDENNPGTGQDGRMCAHVWAYNGKLFIRDNAMKLFVLDESTVELLNVLSFEQAIAAPSPYDNNIIYYEHRNSAAQYELWEYDCDTNTTQKVDGAPLLSLNASSSSNSFNWFTPSSGIKAGRQLLGITDDLGGYEVYDPTDNTLTTVDLKMDVQAVDIQSLEKGTDGRLYIGGYQYGASIYDINKGVFENTEPNMNQPEGIGFLNGKVYYGTYGSARIYEYDPSKPFNYTYNVGGNPGLAYDIGNDQDRPFALTSVDNKLFIGTVADYGKLGGALTVYDSEAGNWTEYPDVVTDQSITGLAYDSADGKLFGGTSIYGGLGIDPTQDEAKIFVWDVATGTKTNEISLDIPGLGKPTLIGSLSYHDGYIWGIADGTIFAMDPSTDEIVKSRVLTTIDYSSTSTWRPYYIRWGADERLYTTIGRNLVVFDPDTLGYTYLAGGVSLAALGDDGNIYYASGSSLMELPISRQSGDENYKAYAISTAISAIEALPDSSSITLADKISVEAARALVTKAEAKGAVDTDITNLAKLTACEQRITQLESQQDPVSDNGSGSDTAQTPVVAGSTISVTAPQVNNGTAVISVTNDILQKAFDNAKADGKGNKSIVMEIGEADNANAYAASLPADFFRTGSGTNSISIETPAGTAVIDGNMFKNNDLKGAADVSISIGIADLSGVSSTEKELIGNRPVIEISAAVDGNKVSWQNPQSPVRISINYQPTAAELKDPEHIVVYYIDGNGKVIAVPNGRYDIKTGKVTFTTTHFSKYAVSYVTKTFADITDSTAKKQIEVLASKGITNGTSATTFSPDKNITRADFTVLLVRTLGLAASEDSDFSDVKPGDYFYNEVNIAKQLGIIEGIGNNKFNPNGLITRQDMIVLTNRALSIAGKISATGNAAELSRYKDASKVSKYAGDSVAALIKEDIYKVQGDTIYPLKLATRQETAEILYNVYNK